MNEQLYRIVKEMNDAEYACNLMLLEVYKDLLDSPLTASQTILLEYLHQQRQQTVKELAEKLKMTSSAVSQQITKLEQEGYVKRHINPQNRREILVELGEQGHRYFMRQAEVEKSIAERFYAKLEPEELLAMRDLVFKLKGIVEAELTKESGI
ncbi:MarR family winged helix-turn-helix transcriptional regulator [Paenibacillus thailandensis]|uniref:MarR family winged helix-turn-helix transcriptional regulator n=1 Tax=Paenibacillus thailandensis TaxID=393250 RepID=A0ABW5R5G2_9BACL